MFLCILFIFLCTGTLDAPQFHDISISLCISDALWRGVSSTTSREPPAKAAKKKRKPKKHYAEVLQGKKPYRYYCNL